MTYKVILIGLLFATAIGLIYKYTLDSKPKYVPIFHSHECFIFRHHKTNHPDGYITSVSDLEYTVMWYKEAFKRYAGPKTGYTLPIKWLDEYAYRVKCPW